MRTLLVVMAAFVLGCGGSGAPPDPAEQLQGEWGLVHDNGCVLAYTFEVPQHLFEIDSICGSPGGGAAQMEIHTGEFSVVGAELTLAANASTCDDAKTASGALHAGWALVGGTLRLSFSDGELLLERPPSGGGGGGGAGTAVDYGCFADDGTFTQRGLMHF